MEATLRDMMIAGRLPNGSTKASLRFNHVFWAIKDLPINR